MEQIVFTTGIPNDFIDIHLPAAKPVYTVVYIYAFRQYDKGAKVVCCEELAETFDISVTTVEKIWKYWQSVGLVNILSNNDGVMELVFLNPSAQKTEPPKEPQKKPIINESAEYSLEDVQLLLQDPEVERLFYTAETLTGKLLTDVERRMYLGFYDDLGLPVDVISVMLEYCVEKNKTHNNYLRTVAQDWSDRGISTAEEAEEYINLFNNEYREILRYFGISGRDPIEKEVEYMHRWLKEDGFTMDVIKLACERTIITKAQANFPYTDGIFRKWKQDDIKTAEQVEALEKTYYDGVKATRRTSKDKNETKAKKTRFQNYKGRTWDYEKLARMENEYLDKYLSEETSE